MPTQNLWSQLQNKEKSKQRFIVYHWYMTDEKLRERGRNNRFEAFQGPLPPVAASQTCSGALWEVGVACCRDSGEEGMRDTAANEVGEVWSITPSCSQLWTGLQKQTEEIGPWWAQAFLCSSVLCVHHTQKHTHTCGYTCTSMHAWINTYIRHLM